MAKKHFVLRTNSLVAKEGIKTLLSFDSDNQIDIPMPILDELENLTHEYNHKAKNAQAILTYLASWNINSLKSKEGVKQRNGSTLRLVSGFEDINIPLANLSPIDRKCLQIAKGIKQTEKCNVILVTKNAALRIKANSIGINAQDFRDDIFPSISEQYKGRISCQASESKINDFYTYGALPIKGIYNYSSIEWLPNLFLEITCPTNQQLSAIGRYDGKQIVKLSFSDYHPFGISTQNAGQLMLLEALIQPSKIAPIVIAKGGAGTGKTYVSLAAAMEQTYGPSKKTYSQIMVSTPTETVGQERIGFLPGDIGDKFNPHLGGIKDNLRILLEKSNSNKKGVSTKNVESYFNDGKIQVQPIGFLRGKTITDTFFIIDETQNIAPDDIKSIVSRAGKESKFVFLGDPTQIDNPQLNENYNGLVYLSEKMKDVPLAWQISLQDNESVRSELARLAAKIL